MYTYPKYRSTKYIHTYAHTYKKYMYIKKIKKTIDNA